MQADLTKHWCEDAYVKTHGITAPWSGKEAKLMQTLILWAESNFHMEAEEKIKRAMKKYLDDDDPYYAKGKHPFSLFVSNRSRWFAKAHVTMRIEQKKEVKSYEPKNLTDEEILKYIQADPQRQVAGLIELGGMMKAINPKFYERVRRLAFELLGREKSEELILTHKKVKNKLQFEL